MSIVRYNDPPQPWDGANDYAPFAKCTHQGKIWQAAASGVYNKTLEPAGLAPFFWSEVRDETGSQS